MTIWFATGNIHKKKELSDILSPFFSGAAKSGAASNLKIDLRIPAEAGFEFEPEENGTSFLENALIKARELHRLLEEKRPPFYKSGDPVIADDSGLCVDALGGKPGIYSARYGGKDIDSKGKNALLLAELGDNPRRGAHFVCAMILYFGNNHFFAAQETLEGELVRNSEAARGNGGFGYDPILYIPSLYRTVAELADDEKNRISHRGKAGMAIGKLLC